MTKSNQIYIICIINVNIFTLTERHIVTLMKVINSFKLFMKFVKYVNIFNIKASDILTSHNKNDHVINLNRDKSSFEFLYNLLVKELEILRTYLNISLKKR
jgi:hypothetical protein